MSEFVKFRMMVTMGVSRRQRFWAAPLLPWQSSPIALVEDRDLSGRVGEILAAPTQRVRPSRIPLPTKPPECRRTTLESQLPQPKCVGDN
jgi:hypothetical protein